MVERGGLENRCRGNPSTEGSNPSPSAIHHEFGLECKCGLFQALDELVGGMKKFYKEKWNV